MQARRMQTMKRNIVVDRTRNLVVFTFIEVLVFTYSL